MNPRSGAKQAAGILVAALTPLTAAPAAAQGIEHRRICYQLDRAYSADETIVACRYIIYHSDPSLSFTASRVARAFYFRGEAYHRLRDLPQAISDYTEAINRLSTILARQTQEDPDLKKMVEWSHHYRGEALESRGEYSLAMADFDRLVAINPNSADYRNHACWVRAAYSNRQLDLAREHCDAAVRLQPGSTAYLDSRGLVALKQGRYQDAWDDYDAAIRIKSDGAHYWYGRGIAALRLGQTYRGKLDVEFAKKLDPAIATTYESYGIRP